MYVSASFVIQRHNIFAEGTRLQQKSNFDNFSSEFLSKKPRRDNCYHLSSILLKFYWLPKQVFGRVNMEQCALIWSFLELSGFCLFAAHLVWWPLVWQSLFRIWKRFPYFYTSLNMLSNILPEEKLLLQENRKPVWKHMDLHISLSILLEDVKGILSLHWH